MIQVLSKLYLAATSTETMLQRSSKLLKLLHNISRYNNDCLYVFQVGYVRKSASTLITCNYGTRYNLCIIRNPQKVFDIRKIGHPEEWKCIFISMSRPISTAARIQKEVNDRLDKSQEKVQQTITELKKENLGQLKERKLDFEPVCTVVDSQSKKEKQQDPAVEGTEGVTAKKGFFSFILSSQFS